MADYEELKIVITHSSGIWYHIQAQGTVSAANLNEKMDLDRDSPELHKCLAAIRSGRIEKELLQRCGSFLFRKLFSGRTRTAYAHYLKVAQDRGREGVRITLDFAPNTLELYALPWTALYDPERALWMGEFNSPLRLPLSISVPGQPPLPPIPEIPLRILVVGANPLDLPPLEVYEEAAKIEKALFNLRKQGLINTELLSGVEGPITRKRLHEKISSWNPHILHIVGHGPQEEVLSSSGVYLENEDKAKDFYPVDALQGALQLWGQNVRIVVLSACNTALAARQLASKGIPAIGMGASILGSAAVSFSHGFYEALITYALPMDDAVNRARSMVRLDQQEDECGWLSPMLFLPRGRTIPLVPSDPAPIPPVDAKLLPKVVPAVEVLAQSSPTTIARPARDSSESRHRRRWGKFGTWPAVLLVLLFPVGQHLATDWSRIPPDMAHIPAGRFQKGGESTPMIDLLRRYGQRVKLGELIKVGPERGHIDQPFFIDVYEVTNESYAGFLRFVRTQPNRRAHPWEPAGKDHTPETWDNPKFSRPGQPVVGVDAYAAEAYCQWAGKRLPTSEEWERASRGTDGRLYPWGNEFHKDDANTGEGPEPQPVVPGSYPDDRSPERVFDLGGNVSEWTASPDEINGTAARAVAGASWMDTGEIYALTFLRRATSLGYQGENLGFRCVRTARPREAPPVGMVLVPAGDFVKGGEDSALLNFIRHSNLADSAIPDLLGPVPEQVWLEEFLLDRHEVTNREYGRFLQALAAAQTTGAKASDEDRTPAYWQEPQFNHPDQPVVGVDWDDAGAYCRWAGKRLPTSDEWERAARGTEGRLYPWGNEFDPKRCNTEESLGEDKTSPVASHLGCVSPEGVFDLVGNVDEWTADKPSKAGDINNPRVIRGGGWSDSGELRGLGYLEIPAAVDYHGQELGFRCAGTPHKSWLEKFFFWAGTGLERRTETEAPQH